MSIWQISIVSLPFINEEKKLDCDVMTAFLAKFYALLDNLLGSLNLGILLLFSNRVIF